MARYLAANLLAFIASNFAISGDLPRIGYLTLLDTLLVITFTVTGILVIIDYLFRRIAISSGSTSSFILWKL